MRESRVKEMEKRISAKLEISKAEVTRYGKLRKGKYFTSKRSLNVGGVVKVKDDMI